MVQELEQAGESGEGSRKNPDFQGMASAWCGIGRGVIMLAAMLLSVPILADPLRISGVAYLGDLPTLVAERDGHFAQQGLDVAVTYAESGHDNLRELRAGEIDFALMAMTPLVFDALANPARGGPEDPVILANLSHARPVIHLVMLDAGGAPLADALRGRRVGVPRRTNAEYVLHVMASIEGLTDDDYTVVDLAPTEMGGAMVDGRISAASVWEPWAQRLRERFGGRLTEELDVGRYMSRWMIVARRETVDTDPENTLAVLQAYRGAVDWIQENPEAALAVYQARAPGAAGVSGGRMLDLLFDVTLDWSLIASYRQQLSWGRAQQGVAESEVLPSFMDLVAPAPLAVIAPEAVLIPLNAGHAGGYGQ